MIGGFGGFFFGIAFSLGAIKKLCFDLSVVSVSLPHPEPYYNNTWREMIGQQHLDY